MTNLLKINSKQKQIRTIKCIFKNLSKSKIYSHFSCAILIATFSFSAYSSIDKKIDLPPPSPHSFKDTAIKYLKKWTYWDYFEKPKWFKPKSESMPANNIALTSDPKPNIPEIPKEEKKIEEISKQLNEPAKNISETIKPPHIPDEFEEKLNNLSKRIPHIDLPESPANSNNQEIKTLYDKVLEVEKKETIDSSNQNQLAQNVPIDNPVASPIVSSIDTPSETTVVPPKEDNSLKQEISTIPEENKIVESDKKSEEIAQNLPQTPPKIQQNKVIDEATLKLLADQEILMSEGKKSKDIEIKIEQRLSKSPEEIAKEQIEAEEIAAFVEDEMTMLLMPQDDVELGKVTLAAKLTYSDDSEFFKIFWDIFDSSTLDQHAVAIRNYIYNIENSDVYLDIDEAKNLAISAIKKDDIHSLRYALNHSETDLLKLSGPDFNLLQFAIDQNQYNSIYYILMRGKNNLPFQNIEKSRLHSINWVIDKYSRKFQ